MLSDIIKNWNTYCVERNFVGIGSTRKVHRIADYVVKVHLHPIGYKQSQKELEIYKAMVQKGLTKFFAETYYVDEYISVQKYYQQLEIIDNQSFEIDMKKDIPLIPKGYEDVLVLLDKDFDCFDLKDSSNYGLNEEGKIVFIDYGMSKSLYEKQWVPLAEAGVIPQIDYDYCNSCGEKKELRMYGVHDQDKRCYDCGKE
ncbi:protein kinase [Oceanobacillus kapialis]|uniref:Protein kinase n=1 Tax=Oceanobacillus kapialis TaxID=481353 RepID=A0ABW5Q1E3_9BACI